MSKSGAIVVTAISIFFYICGGLCVFKTKMLVGWAQKNYESSKLVEAYPFANMVTKRWYPTYIRAAGIFIWLSALAIDYLVAFRGFH